MLFIDETLRHSLANFLSVSLVSPRPGSVKLLALSNYQACGSMACVLLQAS